MKALLNILFAVCIAAGSLWCTGDLMRKNDQAVILAGACDLARGQAQEMDAYYQFDKTYVLYGVCAATVKLKELFRPAADPVATANVALALIFWCAATCFVLRFREKISPVILLSVFLSPAILLNTLYVNSSLLSSAFLLLSISFLPGTSRVVSAAGASLFFFLAVGSRADVILLLPLLLWVITPLAAIISFFREQASGRTRCMKSLAVFSRQAALAFAGVAAVLIGLLLRSASGRLFDPIFNWKMLAGYTVFGFGAAGLVFVMQAVGWIGRIRKTPSGLEKLYLTAGLAAFLLPVLFFLPQLHSPRYFWRGCEAILLLAAFGKIRIPPCRRIAVILLFAAVLPLVAGVKMPKLYHPQLTLSDPTCFPTGDGFYPMGATGSFLVRMKYAGSQPLDHNQRVWEAARRTDFRPDASGTVPVLYTPVSGYLLLSASLKGQVVRRVDYSELTHSAFYVDSRSLMRTDPKTPHSRQSAVLARPACFVSPIDQGIGILRIGAEGDLQWGRLILFLNRMFAGNEYRLICPEEYAGEGFKRTVCFSFKPFPGADLDAQSGIYFSVKPPLSLGEHVRCAVAVLPEWMSLQAFKRE